MVVSDRMTEANEQDQEQKRPLTLRSGGTLGLRKPVEAGQVRQSFSHGRSKQVTVEVRKKRVLTPGSAPEPTGPEPAPAVSRADPAGPAQAEPARRLVIVPKTLTEEERAGRFRALKDARKADEEAQYRAALAEADRRRQEEERAAIEARARADDEVRRRTEEVEARRREEEEAKKRTEAEEVRRKEEESRREVAERAGRAAAAKVAALTAAGKMTAPEEEEEAAVQARRPGAPAVKRPVTPARRDEPRRRTGKITVTRALSDDEGERMRSLAAVRRARERERQRLLQGGEQEKIVRDVVIPETITVQELANRMAERGVDVVKSLMRMGVMATVNQVIDADTAELVVNEFGHRLRRVAESDVEIGLRGEADEEEVLEPRAPVVTVMGHVDHGKTSLLDALRATDVAAHEAGGITQHIGAYRVTLSGGKQITFIDTPGHQAFTSMRARGANVTDIVVLVVAADDGIMEQTIEAIRHAKAAQVPIIVAINKIDRPDARPERVRQELLQHELVVEELGGDVLNVEVSAIKKTNLDKLEEAILLQAELLDLKANPNRSAEGVVLEAKLERGRGPVATVLIQKGTLKVGDIFVAGGEWGRVRALIDDRGENQREAGPSTPIEVLGLNGAPLAGDDFLVAENESRFARSDRRFCLETLDRRGRNADIALGGRRHHRKRRDPGQGHQRRDHRLQCPRQSAGARSCPPGRRRDPLLFDHLRRNRRHAGRLVGPVVADIARTVPRQCRNPRGVQHHPGRQGRGLPDHRRHGSARRQGAAVARQRRDPRGRVENVEALQGRGARSPAGL